MVALGAGWNFLFVGGTTLLATRDTSGRVQGFNDLTMFGTMAVASRSAGGLLHQFGWETTNLVAIGLIGLIVAALWRSRA